MLNTKNIIERCLGKNKELGKEYFKPSKDFTICPNCGGDGLDENMKTCKICNGTGEIIKKR